MFINGSKTSIGLPAFISIAQSFCVQKKANFSTLKPNSMKLSEAQTIFEIPGLKEHLGLSSKA